MDNYKLKQIWGLCGTYLVVMLVGLILVLWPDSALSLVMKLIAWVLVAAGAYGIFRNATSGIRALRRWIWPAVELLCGIYVLSNPLFFTNLVGRWLGLVLVAQSGWSLRRDTSRATRFSDILTLVVGTVLVILPQTLINTLLGFAGLVLIAIGVINVLSRLSARHLDEGSDPNIIDADE